MFLFSQLRESMEAGRSEVKLVSQALVNSTTLKQVNQKFLYVSGEK